MKKKIYLLVFLFLQQSAFAQDKLVVLHPLVGDTIDRSERDVFLLFPEITNSDFISATIQSRTDKFYLHALSITGLDIVEIDSMTLRQSREHVEKLLKYFAYLDERENESLEIDTIVGNWISLERELLTAQQRKKIATDAREYFDSNQDAESLGLWGLEKENYIKVNSHSWLVESIFSIVK